MTHAPLPLAPQRKFGETSRTDFWWVQPVAVFIGLSIFVVYATWAAFQGDNYRFGNYLSPFYSPELYGDPETAWFGGQPGWWPGFLRFSPALLILGGPVGFRLTCYYYRGAYYKAFWADPPSCSVGEPRSGYLGEQRLPLIIQNIHRYALFIALLFLVVLTWDAWEGLWFDDGAGGHTFGIGVGSLVLMANVVALSCYTLGCHSLRHLVGGRKDRISGSPVRRVTYDCSSCLNRSHMLWAWTSLVIVGFSDVYIRLCSMAIWTDWRIL
jgi:hypothetical protein